MTAPLPSEHQEQALSVMAEREALLPVASLRQILSYDPEAGILTWLERPRMGGQSERGRNIQNGMLAGKVAKGSVNRSGHRQIKINSRPYYVHRVAYALHVGAWPAGFIDHVDGDPSNNRFENLRVATRRENCRNRRPSNPSGFTGVTWYARFGKWRARCADASGRCHFLGYFATAEEAAAERDRFAAREHGAFARMSLGEGAS